MMNRTILMPVLFAALCLSACDKPVVVNVPAEKVVVPGPAGPIGKTGETGTQGVDGNKGVQGDDGNKGEAGKSGDNTTVVITPPAETAPAN